MTGMLFTSVISVAVGILIGVIVCLFICERSEDEDMD